MKTLFTSGTIGALRIKNRSVMEPMEVLYAETSGYPGQRAIAYYEERAKGGTGLIIVEACAIDVTNNVPWPHQLVMASDHGNADYQLLTQAIHKHDAHVFVQLHHYGAKSAPNAAGQPWAPSEIPAVPGAPIPHAMTLEDIATVKARFLAGAKRAQKAGFDGVELAGAHGYLLYQFLDPYYNNRTDAYGGSTENRCRIVCEMIQDIHQALGKQFPVSVRMPGDGCTPQIAGSLTSTDCVKIAKCLEAAGADVLNVSYGNNFNADANCEPYSYAPGWKKHLTLAVKEAVSIPIIATNTIKDPDFAEQMLQEGICDFVGLGRALLADSHFMNKARQGNCTAIRKCIGCMHCRSQLYAQMPTKCTLNPRVGLEYAYPRIPEADQVGTPVVVLGGGAAGMESALLLAQRGCAVTLFEQRDTLGGTMNIADKAPHKEKITKLTETMVAQVQAAGINVQLGQVPTLEEVQALNPAGVVIACGASPIVPKLPGVDKETVVTSHDVLTGKCQLHGHVVVVGSGLTGLECAEKLLLDGCTVSVVEMQSTLGPGMFSVILQDLVKRLAPYQPQMLTNTMLQSIGETGVEVTDLPTGEQRTIPCDHVVLSLGVRPDTALEATYRQAFENVICVGDQVRGRSLAYATFEGYMKSVDFLKP